MKKFQRKRKLRHEKSKRKGRKERDAIWGGGEREIGQEKIQGKM